MIQKLIIILLMLIGTSVLANELKDGENLVLGSQIPDGEWKYSETKFGKSIIKYWVNESLNEFFVAKQEETMKGFPAKHARTAIDSGLKKECQSLSSDLILNDKTNGYKRVIWFNECTLKKGGKMALLNLYIQGQSFGHHVVRKWSQTPYEQDKSAWIRYVKSVSVCNTKKTKKYSCSNLSQSAL